MPGCRRTGRCPRECVLLALGVNDDDVALLDDESARQQHERVRVRALTKNTAYVLLVPGCRTTGRCPRECVLLALGVNVVALLDDESARQQRKRVARRQNPLRQNQ